MTIKVKIITVLLAVLLTMTPAAQAESIDFPVPDSIKPAIDFWIKVYTEVDTESGFLHDSRNLSIIYTSLPRDRKTINNTRDSIRKDLEVLASGKREGLTQSQQELLALWGADVSNERLQQASRNVRWQLGQSDRFIAGLKRSGAYRDHIESVIREKGMPLELSILPHVESSFHPGAYSSAAATGMWQFVRSTAQRFMQVDYVVDERLDPYEATKGAMALLEYNYNALGSWPLALTAYNHGANGIARAIRDVGSADIGQIISNYRGPRFGFASRNFYPQFLAAMEVDTNAEKYYGYVDRDPAPDFMTFEMDSYIDPIVVANSLGVSMSALKAYNPALQPSVWSGTKRIPKGYRLKLDKKVFSGDMAVALNTISATQRFTEQIPDESYTVRQGDSLSVIASRYNTSISELVAINQLRDRNRIRIGQTLLLPQPDGSVPSLVINDTPRAIPADGEYMVSRGDTVSVIAARFSMSPKDVLALNGLNEKSVIYPGQTLRLRGEQVTSAALPNTENIDPRTEADSSNAPVASDAVNASNIAVSTPEVETEQETEALAVAEQAVVNDEADAVDFTAEAVASSDSQDELSLLVDLQSDPSDYSVAQNMTIEIQASETLGHYADWLEVRAWDIRRLNKMDFSQPVIVGRRLKLDFANVSVEEFEQKRQEYHRDLQTNFFSSWRIRETEQYNIKRNDYLVNLTKERSVPLWLFRQYNPEVDSARLQIGQAVVFPVIERVDI